jgi:hypothetical protein
VILPEGILRVGLGEVLDNDERGKVALQRRGQVALSL